ncbi:hypothetical protein FACS189464_1860 [Bacteroidia bacterium]|nr:hypothetical protein FACS189464_1860 [Bacteroidia bacterium]
MVTRENLQTEYPKMAQSSLPKVLQQPEYNDIAEMLEFYDDDKDIAETVDLFIAKLNQVKPKPPKSPEGGLPKVAKKPAKPTKVAKPQKPAVLPSPVGKGREGLSPVTQMSPELEFIKKFVNLDGKVKTKTQVYSLVKSLQRAIVEKRIRKTSQHADSIKYIQNFLVRFHNDMHSGTKTVHIPEAKFNELKNIAAVRWADHVEIIKAFINILNSTRKGTKEKAKSLVAKIEKSKFPSSVHPAIGSITRALKEYMAGKTAEPLLPAYDLEGLYGLAGLSGLGEPPESPSGGLESAPATTIAASDFKNAAFQLMGFTGKWLQLIGNPSEPFKAMIWGTGGSGKSTLALDFALYIAKEKNKRALYVANEEGAGATLHEKMTRLGAFHPNIIITQYLPTNLTEYDFVFADSINSMAIEPETFAKMERQYPHLSWVMMFQTTKEGNFLGSKEWQHVVDVEIYTNNGRAKALKSRFGGKDEIEIWVNGQTEERINGQ